MKKLFYLLFLLVPLIGNAQQPWYKSSPLDYMWMNVGNAGFSGGEADYIQLAFNPVNGEPYVGFIDVANDGKATVMRFDGSNWVYVGNAGFSAAVADYPGFAISPSGEPYMSFSDSANAAKATVMRFDGSSWINVGNAGFSTGPVQWTSLALSPSGQPYVAYQDMADSGKATVMKFDGTNWDTVGNTGCSPISANTECLAFSPQGQPYLAYLSEDGVPASVYVMKFDGSNWVPVGNGIVGWSSMGVDLAFNPSDSLPYVAYTDGAMIFRATVRKFNGTNWIDVGNQGLSWDAFDLSIAFSTSGQPYVAYAQMPGPFPGKASLMKFDGTQWVYVGNAGFSESGAWGTSLAFSPSGQPYVAYSDWQFPWGWASVMKYDSVFTGTNEINNSRCSIYPNPVSKTLSIDLKDLPDNLQQIEINDIKGMRMFVQSTHESKIVINVENYPSGIYIVNMKTKKSTWIGKFCKK